MKMMSLLIMTVFLALSLGILGGLFKGISKGISRMFKPPTPREVLRMRQRSGGLSDEGWELLDKFREQYGTPLEMVAPVLSTIDRRFNLLSGLRDLSQNLNTLLSPTALASQRLATLEQTGALEQELQRQAQALRASGMRSSGLARALMGARMGAMMERARMMADANLQELMLRQQIKEQQYQLREREQMLREGIERDRFRLLMGLRSAFEEQAVKGGALTMDNIFQAEQLATQQMSGLMQGIGALASAYAQFRQQQEMLRAMQRQNQSPMG